MSRVCELTGVGPFSGNKVSHSNIKTRTRWLPNIKRKKYLISVLNQRVSLNLSTRAIRTIDKLGGIDRAILRAKEQGLSPRLRKIRSRLQSAPAPKK